MSKKLLLIYTGGTIGMIKDYKSGALKPFNFHNLINHIPEIQSLDVKIDFIAFKKPIDSSDVTIDAWINLANIIKNNYNNYNGFIILHGTDTMSYTASMLSFMIQGLDKPIILTGSQLPIGDLRTDAKENLITSIYYAHSYTNEKADIQEVCIFFEHKLYRGNRTTKFSAEHFDAFISPNYPVLGESGVNLDLSHEYLLKSTENFSIDIEIDNNIDIFTFFPGKNTNLLKECINSEIKGIILRTFGSGNIPSDKETLSTIQKAKELGKEIVVITQCIRGEVNFGKYINSKIFKDLNLINGYDITVEAATTKLMWLLGKQLPSEQIRILFEKDICGELTKEK